MAADRNRCLLFMSTTVNHGHGRAVVVATGMHTDFGKTFQEMKNVEQRKTPLQVRGVSLRSHHPSCQCHHTITPPDAHTRSRWTT